MKKWLSPHKAVNYIKILRFNGADFVTKTKIIDIWWIVKPIHNEVYLTESLVIFYAII